MERFLALLLVPFLVASAAPARTDTLVTSTSRADVDAYVEQTLAQLPIAGMAVAVIEDGAVVHLAGYGTADTSGAPVTVDTPFPVASVTKSLTSLAARQLVADGRLELSTPVRDVIGEFRLDGPSGGAAITVRDLIDHTSGISTHEGTRPYLHDPQQTFEGALATLASFRPVHEPGTVAAYSNWNAVLLGEVIARTAGRPYADQVTDTILRPLGMDSATFTDPDEVPGTATGNLLVLGFRRPFHDRFVPVMESAGNLTASISDMARYAQELASDGTTVLPVDGQGWYDTVWHWQMGEPDDVAISFSGAHNGFNATIQLLPAHDVAVVLLANTRLDVLLPVPTTDEVSLELARLVAGQPARTFVRADVAGPYAWLDAALGLLAVGATWQLVRLHGWLGRYRRAGRGRKALTWTGIAGTAVLAAALGVAPSAFGTTWAVILDQRPVVVWPILVVAGALVAGATAKLGLLVAARRAPPDPPPPSLPRPHRSVPRAGERVGR